MIRNKKQYLYAGAQVLFFVRVFVKFLNRYFTLKEVYKLFLLVVQCKIGEGIYPIVFNKEELIVAAIRFYIGVFLKVMLLRIAVDVGYAVCW